MIECDAMRDRMPDVVHGNDDWTPAEAAHLATCPDCSMDWRIVRAGTELGRGATVQSDRVATLVVERLRAAGPPGRVVGRLPWRGGLIGLLAAAASVALFLEIPRHDRVAPGLAGDSAVVVAMLPELQGLDSSQLQSVLQSMGPTAADATPGVLPHLEDLTDSELEQLLRSEGGQ